MNKANLPLGPVTGFEKYGMGHILWLLGALAALVILCKAYKGAAKESRRRLKICLAVLGLGMQLLRGGLFLLRGEYTLAQLPLHLCNISVYLCFVYAFWPGKLLGQFLYAFSLPGWILALLFPGWSGYELSDAVCILSFMLHIAPIGFVLMQLSSGELKPDMRWLPKVCALMLFMVVPVYIIDVNTGQNFMFLNYPPRGTPLALFAFLGRPGYLLGVLPMAGLIWCGMYGPFLKGRKKECGLPRRFAPRNDKV